MVSCGLIIAFLASYAIHFIAENDTQPVTADRETDTVTFSTAKSHQSPDVTPTEVDTRRKESDMILVPGSILSSYCEKFYFYSCMQC
jgi:uncharacterized membrane protein